MKRVMEGREYIQRYKQGCINGHVDAYRTTDLPTQIPMIANTGQPTEITIALTTYLTTDLRSNIPTVLTTAIPTRIGMPASWDLGEGLSATCRLPFMPTSIHTTAGQGVWSSLDSRRVEQVGPNVGAT